MNKKKILLVIIFIIFIIVSLTIDYGNRVFYIKNPSEIFIDLNKNLIFDEKKPVVLNNIKYVSKNIDFNKYPILKELTDDEIFFLEYMANERADKLLKNRYVKYENNDILFDNKSYSEEMIKSKFVFNDTDNSQHTLVDNIKSLNLDEYVILNLKNKKYHKLDCENGRKSSKYKIIKKSEIDKTMEKCKNCHVDIPIKTNTKKYNSNYFSTGDIKIFFIDLNKIFKPDNSCKEIACKELKNEIDNSKNTIDFALYGINNQPEIFNALIKAKNRGVKIRRVYDYSEKKYYEDNDKLDKYIKTYKTDEIYDKKNKSALMHNKYFIFDNKTVWTGTSNISSTDLSGFNSNYAVIVNSKEIAKKYTEDFNQMYNGNFHRSKKASNSYFVAISPNIKIKPLFSPQDNIINAEIIPLIKSAKNYIYISIFFITSKKLEEALINAKNKGVEIKIINDATNAQTKYSIHKNLRKAGIKVKTENYAGKMHSKTMVIDDKYSIIGSMNYTKSGNAYNDENVLIIDNKETALFMRTTFLYLWSKIPQRYEIIDPKAESKDSIGSCSDGIDNDFDDKIDMEDEGCFK